MGWGLAGEGGLCSSPDITFYAYSDSVSVPPPCYRSGTQKIPLQSRVVMVVVVVAVNWTLNIETESINVSEKAGDTGPWYRRESVTGDWTINTHTESINVSEKAGDTGPYTEWNQSRVTGR